MEGIMQTHYLEPAYFDLEDQSLALGRAPNHPPPAVSGRRINFEYMTQPKSRPPQFTLFGNQLDALPESYKRYLVNSIRETFDLPASMSASMSAHARYPFEGKRRNRD